VPQMPVPGAGASAPAWGQAPRARSGGAVGAGLIRKGKKQTANRLLENPPGWFNNA